MVSISGVLTPSGRTTVQVIWDLKVDPIDEQVHQHGRQSPDRVLPLGRQATARACPAPGPRPV
jgi:hypothetical protein